MPATLRDPLRVAVMASVVAAHPVVGFRHTLCHSWDVLGATGHEDNDSP
jgi:hypothetical protein